jgi:alpha-mannosidase
MAKFEAYGRWASLSEESRGVSLMSDIKGGYDVHENVIRLSLLKAAMESDRWEDFGMRKSVYRAVFHNANWIGAHIPQLHDELVHVPVVVDADPSSKGTVSARTPFVVVDDDFVIIDTLKVAESADGFIVRLYEASGGLRRARVNFPLLKSEEWAKPVISSLLEEPVGLPAIDKVEGQALTFYVTLNAFQVLTLKIARVK